MVLSLIRSLKNDIHNLTVAGESVFNDNQLNTVQIQAILDRLNDAGYPPEVTVDENGQQWISAPVNESLVQVVKLSKENFGKGADLKKTEAIVDKALKEVLPVLKSKDEKKKEEEEKTENDKA